MRRWLRLWRDEPIDMWTPDPIDVVRARLRAGSISGGQAFRMLNGASRQVIARVGERRVVVRTVRPFMRNSWDPVVRGRLVDDAGGTRLIGTMGVAPIIKVLSAVQFGAVGAVLVVASVTTAIGFLFTAAMAVALVGITALGERMARPNAAYLREWLTDRLHSGLPAGLRFPRH